MRTKLYSHSHNINKPDLIGQCCSSCFSLSTDSTILLMDFYNSEWWCVHKISLNYIYSKVMRGIFECVLVLISSHILKLQYNNSNRLSLFILLQFSTTFHTSLAYLHASSPSSLSDTCLWSRLASQRLFLSQHNANRILRNGRTSKAGMLSE